MIDRHVCYANENRIFYTPIIEPNRRGRLIYYYNTMVHDGALFAALLRRSHSTITLIHYILFLIVMF